MEYDSDQKNNLSPSHSELENLLSLYQNKQYDLAEKTSSKLAEKFPKHPFAWTVLGAIFNQTGKFHEAVSALQKSILIEPKNSEAHNNLGNTFFKLDRLEEAEKSCRKAIALNPKNEYAQNNLGQILFKLKKLDEAENAFRNAVSIKQDFVQAYFNLGNTLKTNGKFEEATSIFTKASLIDPNNPELYVFRGLTPTLLARKPLINKDDFMKSINKGDWISSENFLKQSFTEKPGYIEQNVKEFVNIWCALCIDFINQNDIERLIPIFIKLLVTVQRNKDLNNLIQLFFENFDIDEVLGLVEPKDKILINLSYCQYNYLMENFKQAEAIAIKNIQEAESLIKAPQTEDLGWLIVDRSLESCTQKDVSRTALTNLVTNLVN